MKISHVAVYQYELPLKFPLPVKNFTGTVRSGFLLKVIEATGMSAISDIAPLPGLSLEGYFETARQVREIAEKLRGFVCEECAVADYRVLLQNFQAWPLFPSVRFGLEMVLLRLLALRAGVPLCRYLNPESADRLNIIRLLSVHEPQALQEEISAAKCEGYQSFKIKAGRQPLELDIKILRYLLKDQSLPEQLRLDANRSWSWDEALKIAAVLKDSSVQYLEEPLHDPALLPKFYQVSGMPLALDESLSFLLSDENLFQGIRAFVLKPTLLNGFLDVERLCHLAQQNNIAVIFSSTFESSVGLATLAELAMSLSAAVSYAGLDTTRWFAQDLSPRSSLLSRGQWTFGDLEEIPKTVDLAHLKRIV